VINKSMAGIVKNLDSALKANNLEKVANTMDQVGASWQGGLLVAAGGCQLRELPGWLLASLSQAGCCIRLPGYAQMRWMSCCHAGVRCLMLLEGRALQQCALNSSRSSLCHPRMPPPLVRVQFERQFENLDVQSEFVEQAMQNQAVLSTPEDDVNTLVQQARAPGGCFTASFAWSQPVYPQWILRQSWMAVGRMLAARWGRLPAQGLLGGSSSGPAAGTPGQLLPDAWPVLPAGLAACGWVPSPGPSRSSPLPAVCLVPGFFPGSSPSSWPIEHHF
jgi:hypothetical protein